MPDFHYDQLVPEARYLTPEQKLAIFLLTIPVGQRIPTFRDISKRLKVSLGSVSQTLSRFESCGAIQLDKRRRSGTKILGRNLGVLWSLVQTGPLVVALPLPASPRLEGLATALKAIGTQGGIDVFFMFVRGARYRLSALDDGKCHLVIMSAFAAQQLNVPPENQLLQLPPGSFVSEHRVFYTPSGSLAVTG